MAQVGNAPRASASRLSAATLWFSACAHLYPALVSASVTLLPDALTEQPTAVHALEAGHETPARSVEVAPVEFGTGSIDQRPPLSVSARAGEPADPAVQSVAVAHETAESMPGGFQLDWKVQEEPFHCPTSVPGGLPLRAPTAVHATGEGQETLAR